MKNRGALVGERAKALSSKPVISGRSLATGSLIAIIYSSTPNWIAPLSAVGDFEACFMAIGVHKHSKCGVIAGDTLIQLYHNFITDFEKKINLLKLAHFAVIVSRQYSEKEAAIGYLEGVVEKLLNTKEMSIEEPILYIKLQIALFKLEQGDQKECNKLLELGKITLDCMTDIDPSVYASLYWVSSQYHKARQEFVEFYKNALLCLAYTSVDSLSESFKLDLAFDLSLSALLGDNVYNFRELLAPPINEKMLLEKINILCLMEIIFSRPAEDRTIPLSALAERTKLSVENVEYLLMKSLSVHLIEGIMDQVEGTVHVCNDPTSRFEHLHFAR
uniref:26S proteasome non-ATPase regulatory subunit 13 homolog B-like n=1 Tax=Nicotiana tabacum TaxID=4097 RepID=A0A1S4CD90_TOBAC|nr:PREDICTED: 26S proteasome non-ATPase regulatory subunit 13 homolog B-like [Nicotiana tabacum]